MKTPPNWHTPGWRGHLLAFFTGVTLSLSLAPYDKWALGIVSASLLAALLKGQSAKQGFYRSLLFGLGMYFAGTSWVYVSIYEFGNAPAPLALLMTATFVSFLALVFALPFYFYSKFIGHSTLGFILGFPSVWILGEWIRSWLLTGFPWLYLGYGHIDTWLSGWAPIVGVFGVGWLAIVSGNCVIQLICSTAYPFMGNNKLALTLRAQSRSLIVSLLAIWLSGLMLKFVNWVKPSGESVKVALVQPNIPLEMKWNELYRPFILDTLRELSEPAWEADLVVWPEAALPMLYTDATSFIEELDQKATETQSALITGLLYDDYALRKYYNAIAGFGLAQGMYFKQRLVPFGEYVPLENQLRGLIEFFDLPNSIIHRGPKSQANINADHYSVAPYICYEIVYPDLVAKKLQRAEVIVTISNDAWFGDSIGPLQHYQMAQMRALENGRFVIRATNTGLSGVISPKGLTVDQGEPFKKQTIFSEIKLMRGTTPFSYLGSSPVIIFCCVLLFFRTQFSKAMINYFLRKLG